jgi:2-oxoglutarate ferredoxin oxidoreductase subunit delta
MRSHTIVRRHETEYIRLNMKQCQACWKCVEACPENVLARIRIPFHKHARIANPHLCKGCLKCVEACPQQAITPQRVIGPKEENNTGNSVS